MNPLAKLLSSDPVWTVLDATVLRVTRYIERVRHDRNKPVPADVLAAVECLGLTVRHGPFAGMKYPKAMSTGSLLYPKLLGSYEREVQHLFSRDNYSAIVDIGCAEGYYAVGLGLRNPKAKIYAFDTNPDALDLCAAMAALNGVSVSTARFCNAETLLGLDLGPHALIVSDCEGYEVDLFNENVLALLWPHDLFIELHDPVDLTISFRIKSRLTRPFESFLSSSDIQKAHTYRYPELETYDLHMRHKLLAEGRWDTMEWIFVSAETVATAQRN